MIAKAEPNKGLHGNKGPETIQREKKHQEYAARSATKYIVMSMVSVYRSVPSPQSDLYRYPRASESSFLRNPGGQGEDSKMNFSSGGPPILSPSSEDALQPGTGGDGVVSGGGSGQHPAGLAISLPKPTTAQFVPQLPKLEDIDPSLKPVSHGEDEDAKDRVVQQNQMPQSWNGGESTSGPAPSGREQETAGEENDEEFTEELSNGEEGDGQGKSAGDAGDDKKKTKRFRWVAFLFVKKQR